MANVPEDPDLIAKRLIAGFLALLQASLSTQGRPTSEDLLFDDQDLIKRLSGLLLEAPSSRLPAEKVRNSEKSSTPSLDPGAKHHVRFLSTPDISRPISRTFGALSRSFRRDRSATVFDEKQAPPTISPFSSPDDRVMATAITEIKGHMMKRLSSIMQGITPNERHDPKVQARAGLSLALYGNSIAALMALNHVVALRSLDENTASSVSMHY